MAAEHLRLSPDERSNLVAYLDNELAEREREAIASKLAHSATARRELEALSRCWELLDHLDRPRASDGLSTRTATIAQATVTNEDRLTRAAGSGVRLGGRLLLWIGVPAVAFGLGLAVTRWIWPNPTERLARRLTVAERLDEYEAVQSLEFLELLEKAPQF